MHNVSIILSFISFLLLLPIWPTTSPVPPSIDKILQKNALDAKNFDEVTLINIGSQSTSNANKDFECLHHSGEKLVGCMACLEHQAFMQNFIAMNPERRKCFLLGFIKTLKDLTDIGCRFTDAEWQEIDTVLSPDERRFLLPKKNERELFVAQFMKKVEIDVTNKKFHELSEGFQKDVIAGLLGNIYLMMGGTIYHTVRCFLLDDYKEKVVQANFEAHRKKIMDKQGGQSV